MGNRYRRIVTLGMISFTALLAWGYCMLAHRSETLYVAIISLVLVASIYALALAVVDMKGKRETERQQYIEDLLQQTISHQDYTESLVMLERIIKASYVQQRKVNTYLGKQEGVVADVAQMHAQEQAAAFERLEAQIEESLTKAVKILVKYNQSNSEKQVEMTAGMSAELAELTTVVGQITAALQQMTGEIEGLKQSMQALPEEVQGLKESMQAIPEEVHSLAESMQTLPEKIYVPEAAPRQEMPQVPETAPVEEEMLVSEVEPIEETAPVSEVEVEETAQIPETESTSENFDAEDFFSQFGGAEETAVEEETVAAEETAAEQPAMSSGKLDQSMIDAMLNNLSAPDKKEEPLADVIPFPQAEEETGDNPLPEPAIENTETSEPEQPVNVESATDNAESAADSVMDNPAESAADNVTETVQTEESAPNNAAEPAPAEDTPAAPVTAPAMGGDANRQLTPEEIAALFASVQ